jgi:hypothetical protein
MEKYFYRFSPECPKGGFPISCANEAAATIAQNHSYESHALPSNTDISQLFSFQPNVLKNVPLPKLNCASNECTKSILESGITCVLS